MSRHDSVPVPIRTRGMVPLLATYLFLYGPAVRQTRSHQVLERTVGYFLHAQVG
jgi:hypothetical protein